ncbi:MAG: hypothetical protein LQ339_003233 [Xanthoria mediterranea]|nr:MAG: hypothetical protein LQ339_003233 [Xanthoria mediterranea]
MLSTAKPKVAAKSSMDWKLFKCVLARHAPLKVDYHGLEQDMRALGYDCTAKAITHRIQKIKSASPPSTDPDAGATPASSPTKAVASTAAKKARASPTKKAAANGKGKAAAGKGKATKRKHEEMEDGSDVTEGEGEKKMKVKEEDEEDEDEEDEDEEAGVGEI